MRVLIFEDEQPAAARLIQMLQQLRPQWQVVAVIDTVEAAINWLSSEAAPDLIFSDIELADGSSFEIFEQKTSSTPIIFVTAYNSYAVEAFQLNSIGYVLKPLKQEDVKKAIEKWEQLKPTTQIPDLQSLIRQLQQPSQPVYIDRFLVKIGPRLKVVLVSDAAYFFSEHKITYLVTKQNDRYPLEFTLEQLEQQLSPQEFYRINRQFIVRMNAIKDMQIWSKSRIKLTLNPAFEGDDIVVSSERCNHFKMWLSGGQN